MGKKAKIFDSAASPKKDAPSENPTEDVPPREKSTEERIVRSVTGVAHAVGAAYLQAYGADPQAAREIGKLQQQGLDKKYGK